MENLNSPEAPPKTKKIKTTINVNGEPKEVEIEVPDIEASWGKKADRKTVGQSYTRLDGYDKVTGRAKYTYDINLPGMLHGKILHSPYAKAKIAALDLEPAKKMPGVRSVVALKGPGSTVHYHGDEIAALAADTPEIAEDAIRAIKVTYEPLPFASTPKDAMKEGAPTTVGNRPNVEGGIERESGDAITAFANAKATIEGYFEVPGRVHACLETHGHVVAFRQDGSLKVWSSTQAVHDTAEEFAGMAKLPKDRVELVCQHMGGGFGSKFGARPEGNAAFQLAKQTGQPVKLMLDRAGEATASGNAPSGGVQVKMAANDEGKIIAVDADGWSSGGIGGGGYPFPYIYDRNLKAAKIKRSNVRTNIQPAAAMRAPGHPQGSFLMESAVDALAYKLGMDPLEMRLRNDGWSVRQAEYRIGAERIDWAKNFNKTPGQGGSKLRGVGVAAATWGGGGGNPDLKAEVAIALDGSVTVRVGTQDLGTGVRTFVGAIVADELEIPRERVRVEIGSSRLPYSGGSGGSTTTPSVAPPVKMAAIQAKFDFTKALSRVTGEPQEKIQLLPGGKVSNGTKTMTWEEACKRLPAGGLVSIGQWNNALMQSGIGGVQFAQVEVDMETGRVRLLKIVAVHDAGIVMNRLTMESQINGGVIQGLGFALLEDIIYDSQTGRMLNANLEEYKLPGPWEMPIIEPVIYEPPDAKGVSGMAEAAVIPTAAAIANAVYNACGARVQKLPLTPAHVLEAMGKVPARKESV